MKQAAIIIPTTGNSKVEFAIESAMKQTYQNTKVYVVVDGAQYSTFIDNLDIDSNKVEIYHLPENTGANGQNGHRIYSAMSFLINADYILYLDQDCWFDENHVESCINLIQKNDLDWCYSLRKIYSKHAEYICDDNCESVGKYNAIFNYKLVDTNCYCIKREVAMLVAPYFVGTFGHDRRVYTILENNFNKFETTGLYTTNYRLGGDNNLTPEFFINNNNFAIERYKHIYGKEFPWKKEI